MQDRTRPFTGAAHWLATHHVSVLLIATLALFPFSKAHQLPLAMLAIVGMVRMARAGRRDWTQPQVRLFLTVYGLLFIPLLLSTFHAIDLERAIGTGARYLMFLFVGLGVLFARLPATTGRTLLGAVLIITTVWVLDALMQVITGENLLGYPLDGSPTGLFHPRRSLGIMLAHLLPFYLEALRRLSPGRPWNWMLVVAYVAVILLSGTRTAWITAILALGAYSLYLAIIHRESRMRMAATGVAVLLASALAVSFSPGLQDRLERTAAVQTLDFDGWDHATSYRISIWSEAIPMLRDHWTIGVGARGFQPVIAVESGSLDLRVYHAHLFVLDVSLTTGVIGLIAYLGALGVLLVWYFRGRGRHPAMFAPWLAVILALFPLNAHWYFYGTFVTSLLWFIFLVTMILARETEAQSTRS